MTKITFNLSTVSLNKAIKELKAYKKQIEQNCDIAAHRLADEGREIATEQLSTMAKHGNLLDIAESLTVTETAKGYKLSTRNFKAPYVEFGTGVKGLNSPHPQSQEFAWAYKVGAHIGIYYVDGEYRTGWWYPTTPDDMNNTLTLTESGDYIAFTEGMESRPFMHNTATTMRERAQNVFREVFNDN
jgi:hypothetical protein